MQDKVQVDNGDAEQVFAADYDPSQDRREDEQRRVRVANGEVLPDVIEDEEEDEEDIDDMFAVAMGEQKKVRKIRKVTVSIVLQFLFST
jgi:serine/threonine-protein kinase PRP4